MPDAIRVATKNDFPILREFLRKKLPSSMSILTAIEVTDMFYISRKIYVTNSDPTLFIFVTNMQTEPSFCTFWDIERTSEEEALQYLKSVPDWNWNETFYMSKVESSLANYVDEMILKEKLSSKYIQREFLVPCFTFQMHAENVPELKLPKGFKIGKLKPHQTKFILSKWAHGQGKSVSEYEEYIRKLPSAAIYREEDNDEENPVSWAVVRNHGSLGMIYTLPPFRRLGLATVVEITLCKRHLEGNLIACVEVAKDNKQSMEMHMKSGFKIMTEAVFACYVPA